MKIGITLPQFRDDATDAIAAARAGERAGLDGIFVFDHLWAIGQPDRPALNSWPLLGALTNATSSIALGTLVARVGLVPNALLAHQFASLQRMVAGNGRRIIAGIGTGDSLSRDENLAYGIPYEPLHVRVQRLVDCCRRTRALGIETWVGGLSPMVRRVAATEADALNLWGVASDEVERERASSNQTVTWGGVVGKDSAEIRGLLQRLRDAGAAWAVCSPRVWPEGDPEAAIAPVVEAASE